jgi:predicted adenylyl cyclase CyaB
MNSGRIFNIEIKARCTDHEAVRKILRKRRARFSGTDHQIDTYFRVKEGRLKLRLGNIEKSLIWYRRPDQQGPKQSDVLLHKEGIDENLRSLLEQSLGVLVEVDKKREIYFIDNVKVHLDEVKTLGSFLEIEVMGRPGKDSREALEKICREFMDLFGVKDEDLVDRSYSDMMVTDRRSQSG